MSILPTLNSTGCLRADLNVNLARHATSSLLIKIRNLSGKHARWMSLFALRLFYIFFSFGLLILEHTKLSPHIMCKSNCKSEVIRCCLILCIERLFNVFKVFNEICEIVYSSTDSNKTVKALKDFTLTGPFLYFREVIKTSQQRWIHVFFICFFPV